MDLTSASMRRDPYPFYASMHARAPVVHDPRTRLWMIFDHAGVKRALMDHETFGSDVGATRGVRFEWLIFFDPPRHTKVRAFVTRAFTPKSVADLEPRIRALADDLLDHALAHETTDFSADFAQPLPMMVIAAMLGVAVEDYARYSKWSDAILELAATIAGTEDAARAASAAFLAANEEMSAFVEREIEERRRVARDDLLSRLVHAEIDGERLSHEEILRFFQLLLLAGSETTTNLLGNAVLSFLHHPSELARVRADPRLLSAAIEEVLRHRSPVQAMFRATRRDVEVGGTIIPKGEMVLAMIGAANRDPRVFPEPDRFDVGRDASAHLAFGQGVHFCVGAPLARLEARVALPAFLSRVRHFEFADADGWTPRRAFHVHGPTQLRLRIDRGSP